MTAEIQFPEALTRKNYNLLRLPQVLKRFPVSRSCWWAGVKAGRFPKPIKLGPRTSAWLESDIDGLIERLSNEEPEA
jgi:predicted DNA-binding transcriptional regulator AlpA